MQVEKMINYITYADLFIKGRKPRLNQHIEFDYEGHHYKGVVVEVGATVQIKQKTPLN